MYITKNTDVKFSECFVIKFHNNETSRNFTVNHGTGHPAVFKVRKQNKHIGILSNTNM
jgi:hypothetical protein